MLMDTGHSLSSEATVREMTRQLILGFCLNLINGFLFVMVEFWKLHRTVLSDFILLDHFAICSFFAV